MEMGIRGVGNTDSMQNIVRLPYVLPCCVREFTKGGFAIYAFPMCNCNTVDPFLVCKLKTCLSAKPPFTKPPFVNSRCVVLFAEAELQRARHANGASETAIAETRRR